MAASLLEELHARLHREGSMSFRDFMEVALYHPEHGYYASGRAQIGRGGDFFTSVSVGPLLGALLARQLSEMWGRLGEPGGFTLVEQGAHRADLARDILAALREQAPACFDATQVVLVEPSAAQKAVQQEALAGFFGKVEWVDSVEELPPFTGVHLSNELLDAFPVHAVTWDGAEWRETHVALRDGALAMEDRDIDNPSLQAALQKLPAVPAGYRTEINLAALAWIDGLAARIQQGYVMVIDYGFSRDGYYRPERNQGTLTGYAQHRRVEDLLTMPGEIDLTAHVDFTALAERATRAGFKIRGFTDQHHFLVALGGLHFPDDETVTPQRQKELRAFKTLMHPQMMGRSFQVLCLEKEVASAAPLTGWRFAGDAAGKLGL